MWPFDKLFPKKKEQYSEPVNNSPDLNRINLRNPRYTDAGHMRAGDALMNLEMARIALRNGDIHDARVGYLKAVESWKQANQGENNRWEEDLSLAKKEYADFVVNDPLYVNGLSILIEKIKENPGILQTELYKQVEMAREDVSYILYFAAEMGVIKRTKKGRSYQIEAV